MRAEKEVYTKLLQYVEVGGVNPQNILENEDCKRCHGTVSRDHALPKQESQITLM
jgi:hypothetical protein